MRHGLFHEEELRLDVDVKNSIPGLLGTLLMRLFTFLVLTRDITNLTVIMRPECGFTAAFESRMSNPPNSATVFGNGQLINRACQDC